MMKKEGSFVVILMLIMFITLFCFMEYNKVYATSTQTVVKKTGAQIVLGDIIEMGRYNGRALRWKVVAFYDEVDGLMVLDKTNNTTSVKTTYPLLVAEKILMNEDGTTVEGKVIHPSSNSKAIDPKDLRNIYGSNRWATSVLRRWLNSTKEEGSTKYITSIYDGVGITEKGFLNSSNFTSNEYNAIKEVTLRTVVGTREQSIEMYEDTSKYTETQHIYSESIDSVKQNHETSAYVEYTTDKVFLLGMDQLQDAYDRRVSTGFDYFTNNNTWYRDASSSTSYDYRRANLSRGVTTNYAKYSYAMLPAFFLNPSSISLQKVGKDTYYT